MSIYPNAVLHLTSSSEPVISLAMLTDGVKLGWEKAPWVRARNAGRGKQRPHTYFPVSALPPCAPALLHPPSSLRKSLISMESRQLAVALACLLLAAAAASVS